MTPPVRAPVALYAISLLILSVWAVRTPLPFDWDSAACAALARRILAGEGATTISLWQLLIQTGSLPMPADLHWMPLPSRVLLPGLLLHPQGDRITSVLLGASLAPLAWAWANLLRRERPDLPTWTPILAGLWAATGGASGRYLVVPDSVAPFGLSAGLTLLLAASNRPLPAAAAAAAAALCRNDGFLVGIAASLGLLSTARTPRNLLPALAGLTAWLAWQFRCAALVPGWWSLRAQFVDVLDFNWMIIGKIPEVTWIDRASFLLARLPPAMLLVGLVALPLPMWAGLRQSSTLRGVYIYMLLLPLVGCLLAPGIFLEGSFFRSSIALLPVGCALAAEALGRLSRWSSTRYHPLFLPGIVAVCCLALQMSVGPLRARTPLFTPEDCVGFDALPPGAVFSDQPPMVEAICRRAAVILPEGLSEGEREALRERYGVVGEWGGR